MNQPQQSEAETPNPANEVETRPKYDRDPALYRPLIGITGRRKYGRDFKGNIDALADAPVDYYYAEYSRAVSAAGAIPVNLTLDEEALALVEHLDGVLLSGGADVDPKRYGAPRHEKTEYSEPLRDEFEFNLLKAAAELDMPVLGICRGHQLINVACGGTLIQDIASEVRIDVPRTTLTQKVDIEANTLLSGLYGKQRDVNSLHHQAVDQVGSNLKVVARNQQGTIEALEHLTKPVLSVQWHPEMMASAMSDPIFTWLVDASRSYATERNKGWLASRN